MKLKVESSPTTLIELKPSYQMNRSLLQGKRLSHNPAKTRYLQLTRKQSVRVCFVWPGANGEGGGSTRLGGSGRERRDRIGTEERLPE